jgi:sugar phosphate isomerase/epimerase
MTMNDHATVDWPRREWLRRVALAGLSAELAGSPARGANLSPEADVCFGFSLYGMKSIPLPKAIPMLAAIGYDAAEIVCTQDWPTAPEQFTAAARRETRQLLATEGIRLPSLMEHLPLLVEDAARRAHLDRIQSAGELGHELSPDAPPVLETVLGGKSRDWPQVKHEMVEELGRWSEAAESVRTIVAVKPHVSGAVWTPESADWLVRQVNSRWIRLVYDFSHYQVHDFDLEKSLSLLLPQTVFIHVKDHVGTADKVQFALPGDGSTDYELYFRTVKQASYRGAVMVEVSSQLWNKPGYDPEQAARRGYSNLRTALSNSKLWSPRAR